MAAQELRRNCNTRYCIFYIDDKSDTQYLPTSKKSGSGDCELSTPCRAGSLARDKTGKQYVLNGSDEWVELPTSSGVGGGGTGGDPSVDLDIATDSEVDGMLEDVF